MSHIGPAFMTDGMCRHLYRHVLLPGTFIASILFCCQPVAKGFSPAITAQPGAQKKTVGDPVTFSVAATGDPSPAYQWRKDGIIIGGATSESYTISSIVLDDAGAYSVVVSNPQGSVTSSLAALLVTTGCPYPSAGPSLNPQDPDYRIISPSGGEMFHVGQPCTLMIWSRLSGSALLYLDIGPSRLTPQEYFGAWGTMFYKDSLIDTVVFTIPDSLYNMLSGENILSVNDSCLFQIANYANPQYMDHSDCYFRIKNP
jgi:hypothetical protein